MNPKIKNKKIVELEVENILHSDFAESPLPVMIEYESDVEKNALFRCRHQLKEANIAWQVNGSSSAHNLDDTTRGTILNNDSLVETLTIPALLEYNGTTVVCVAVFTDGSPTESTPAVTLTVTGLLLN